MSDNAYNTEAKETKHPWTIWNDKKISYMNTVRTLYKQGKITKEKAWELLGEARRGAEKIADIMLDRLNPNNIKALVSTMTRQFMLTSSDDITGNVELIKTANGFVLNASATRSNFRVFMDNDGNVRRMPANELKTEYAKVSLKNSDKLYRKFKKICNEHIDD